MLFSEIYSVYYSTVARIIRRSIRKPLEMKEMRRIISDNAFSESGLYIESAISEGRWPVISPKGRTFIENEPKRPLTTLEKRWMKAVTLDPRYRLFTDEAPDLGDVEPLFRPEDIYVFDRYLDGDDYSDPKYIRNFRTVLKAVREHQPLSIDMTGRRGKPVHMVVMPKALEYSEKDDKFRLTTKGSRRNSVINLGRIDSCRPYAKEFVDRSDTGNAVLGKQVTFTVTDERNALERVMLHFAHFEKMAERLDEKTYSVTVKYDRDDESEMVIRLLSFGPMVKVTAPERFAGLMRERILSQMNCLKK